LSPTRIANPDRRPGRGVAAEEVRRHNLATVLERLHLSGPLSRSDLTSATGLNRSTIADLVGELSDLGLVEEGPAATTSGPGRPSTIVSTRPDGAIVLAVEISVYSIAVAAVGLGGHVYNKVLVSTPRGGFSPRETVERVATLAASLLKALPDEGALIGVGVAFVGITRREDGFVHLAPNLIWRNVPLASMLRAALDVPVRVVVANDADLGALSEQRRGVGVGIRNLIYVSGEVGIGTGVILNGEPLLGAAGYAGEAGHMMMNPAGETCRCGAAGCWETEAGEEALINRAGSLENLSGLAALDAIARRAQHGDQQTLQGIAEVGWWLGRGIGNLINIFNPELVVLGGFYHRLFPFLEESMVDGAKERALDAPWAMVEIRASGLGADSLLIGAAELAFIDLLSDPARFAGASVADRQALAEGLGTSS
jgi:predicted NBD/HSP70 family sugar kinase